MQKTIGIVGGGQLGRMLCQAAQKLGFTVIILDPTPNSPAAQVANRQIVGDFRDATAIKQLAAVSDFITFELESANAQALHELEEQGFAVNPSPQTLRLLNDKFRQKEFLAARKVPVADFAEVASTKEAITVKAEQFGYPMLLKAKHGAYDGRGNHLLRSEADIIAGLEKLAGRDLYIEKFVPFVKELAVTVARGVDGTMTIFPVAETEQKNNICHIVIAPANVSLEVARGAKKLAAEVAEYLKGVGVFCIEMFLAQMPDGSTKVLVNEIAPRVHNSGHYTIEATATSQFEQHIRAITGMPLGSVEMVAPSAVMINILGERHGTAEVAGLEQASQIPNVAVHIYGKMETKPERKMGHITAIGSNYKTALDNAIRARKSITI